MNNRNEQLYQVTKELGRDTLRPTLQQISIDLELEYLKIKNSLDDIELGIYLFEKGLKL